jgi:probable rRNA maturation factor
MAAGIEIFVADEQSSHPVDIPKWRDLADKVVDFERRQRSIGGLIEASLLFVDEATIQNLNERFRNVNAPTDVLSFAIDEDLDDEPVVRDGRTPDGGSLSPTGPKAAEDAIDADMPTLLGDVVICPAIAARNAPDHAGSYDDELALLVVHGILHLFGMDHQDDAEAEVMESREQALLTQHYGPVPIAAWPESHGGLVGIFEDDEDDDDAIDLTVDPDEDDEDDDDDDDDDDDESDNDQ